MSNPHGPSVLPFHPRLGPPSDEVQRVAWRAYTDAVIDHERSPSAASAVRKAATFGAFVGLYLTRGEGGGNAA